MRHPNVITYMGTFFDKGNTYIVTDYMNKGSLLEFLETAQITLEQKYDM